RHFEVALGRGFERGSYGGIHVRGGLAGLGMGRSSEQSSERSSERCSQQQEPQPSSAAPSLLKRQVRRSYQREPSAGILLAVKAEASLNACKDCTCNGLVRQHAPQYARIR